MQATKALRMNPNSTKGWISAGMGAHQTMPRWQTSATVIPPFSHLSRLEEMLRAQHAGRLAPGNGLPGDHQGFGEVLSDLVEVMQHGDHRTSFAVPPHHHPQEVGRGLGIDCGEGFVEHDDRTVLQQHAGKQNALKLPCRQGGNRASTEAIETRPPEAPAGLAAVGRA